LQPQLQAVGFKKKDVLHCSVPSKPPWLLKRPQIDFSMHDSYTTATLKANYATGALYLVC